MLNIFRLFFYTFSVKERGRTSTLAGQGFLPSPCLFYYFHCFLNLQEIQEEEELQGGKVGGLPAKVTCPITFCWKQTFSTAGKTKTNITVVKGLIWNFGKGRDSLAKLLDTYYYNKRLPWIEMTHTLGTWAICLQHFSLCDQFFLLENSSIPYEGSRHLSLGEHLNINCSAKSPKSTAKKRLVTVVWLQLEEQEYSLRQVKQRWLEK